MSAETKAPPAIEGSNAEVTDPTDLEWVDYKAALLATKDEIKRDDVPSMAAGVAFKIFLALFPSLIAAVAIFGLFTDPAQLDAYLAMLDGVMPDAALQIIQGALETDAAAGFAIGGVAAGLWAASSAAATLVKSLNRAYEVEESRNFLKQRGVALAITLSLLAAIGALIVLIIAGPQIQDLVVPDQLQGPIANVLFGIGQVLIVVAVLVAFFAFVYWLGPNRELPRWVWMSPGALLGVVGWLVASLAFTLYVQNFGNYEGNEAYAGLGGVIVLMLWLQISMMVLLIGAEFNAEVERIKAHRRDVRAGAGMGHMEELPEASAEALAAALAPAPAPAPAPATGSSRTAPASSGSAPTSSGSGSADMAPGSVGTTAALPGKPALPSLRNGTGAVPNNEIDLRAPADQASPQTRPPAEPGAGNRALMVGAATAAAAVAALVSAVRNRD
jgi:membrane protein